jgi:hypothetical protein
MLLAFTVVGALSAAASEAVAAFTTGIFPPTWHADAAPAAIGLAVGGAAALAVALDELIRATRKSVELIVAEAERFVEADVWLCRV